MKGNWIKIGAGAVTLALLGFFLMNSSPNYSWRASFKPDSKAPYGCYLLYELLKADRGDEEFIRMKAPVSSMLNDSTLTDASYVFVGNTHYFSPEDLSALVSFIKQGNQAYLLTAGFPADLVHAAGVIDPVYQGFMRDSAVVMSSSGTEDFRFCFKEDWKPALYSYSYLDSLYDERLMVRGVIQDSLISFIELRIGRGRLFLHTIPVAFTNLPLKTEQGFAYASHVFSEMKTGKIYWDDFSLFPHEDSGESPSPLSFILAQESLRWAWYLLLAGSLIYLFIYTRRKQRPMRVPHSPVNTSLEFVKTIGGMYFQQEAHVKIIRHQVQSLLAYIRTHYGVHTNRLDEDFVKKVSMKSGISVETIDYLINESRKMEIRGVISTQELIDFNRLTEDFYRNSN